MIIENVLTEEQFTQLSDVILGENFPWYYNKSSYLTGEPLKSEGNIVDYPQFVHRVFDYDTVRSNVFQYILPIVIKIKHSKLVRIKINLNTQDFELSETSYGVPHIDVHEENCLTAVYYLNDSDGDTILFNEPHGTPFDQLTIKERITPKRNTLVIFPSETLHSGVTPINNKRRVLININVIKE